MNIADFLISSNLHIAIANLSITDLGNLVYAGKISHEYLNPYVYKNHVRFIDGSSITTKELLLSNLQEVLQLPSYFGNNWNALYDCLSSLEDFLGSGKQILIFTNADKILENDQEQLSVFANLLVQVINRNETSDNNRDLKLIFLTSQDHFETRFFGDAKSSGVNIVSLVLVTDKTNSSN